MWAGPGARCGADAVHEARWLAKNMQETRAPYDACLPSDRPYLFLSQNFSACKKVPQLPRSDDYSYDGSRSRVWAAEVSGWALRQRRGRASGPKQGRRSAQVAGLPATHGPRPCSQRRAGPRQKGLPTYAWPSQKTPRRTLLAARAGLGAAPSRERNTAPSVFRSWSPGPEASADRPLRVPGRPLHGHDAVQG